MKCASCIWGPMPDLHLGKEVSSGVGFDSCPGILDDKRKAIYLEDQENAPHWGRSSFPEFMGRIYVRVVVVGHNPTSGCLEPCPIGLSESWDMSRKRLEVYYWRATGREKKPPGSWIELHLFRKRQLKEVGSHHLNPRSQWKPLPSEKT